MHKKPYFRKDEADHQHFLALSVLVRQELGPGKYQNRRKVTYFKAAFLPVVYLLFYLMAIQHLSSPWFVLGGYSMMGILGVFIFLNLIHEATHGLLFRKKFLNRVYLYIFDLLGLNSYVWIQRHNRLHHNYPNLMGWDGDIEQSGIIQIFPQGKPVISTKWQHIYIFILYPFYLFNWVYIRDFKDFFQKDRAVRSLCKIPRIEIFKLFLFKAIYIGYMVILPIILGMPVWLAVFAAICETIAGSIVALVVLLTPHVNTGNQFPIPLAGNFLESSWFRHQLTTTNDISIDNWWTRNCMANFNYHVAHHLFPSISYTQAPELTAILRNYAAEHSLPYKTNTMRQSLYQHYLLVKQNAIQAKAIFSEDL